MAEQIKGKVPILENKVQIIDKEQNEKITELFSRIKEQETALISFAEDFGKLITKQWENNIELEHRLELEKLKNNTENKSIDKKMTENLESQLQSINSEILSSTEPKSETRTWVKEILDFDMDGDVDKADFKIAVKFFLKYILWLVLALVQFFDENQTFDVNDYKAWGNVVIFCGNVAWNKYKDANKDSDFLKKIIKYKDVILLLLDFIRELKLAHEKGIALAEIDTLWKDFESRVHAKLAQIEIAKNESTPTAGGTTE